MHAIRIHETGGPEKLRYEATVLPEPKAGEVRIRVEASGVNFIDTYHRTGLYAVPLPFTPGLEAAGVVTALGAGVDYFKIGDRVATTKATGAYAEEAVAPAAHVVHVPEGVSTQQAASLMMQGMTAHYLAVDTYALKPGDTALIHAAAGGVGLLLTQIAKRRGARVIATAGSEAKAVLARGAGADEVVIYTRDDFAAAARKFTNGRGVDVVYDAVGQSTFEGSLNSLRPRGLFVTYGNASGPVPAIAPLLLTQKGSLYMTRPSIGAYTQTQAETQTRATDLFKWVQSGQLDVRIGATFALSAAADAHRALEGRQTTGKVLLLP